MSAGPPGSSPPGVYKAAWRVKSYLALMGLLYSLGKRSILYFFHDSWSLLIRFCRPQLVKWPFVQQLNTWQDMSEVIQSTCKIFKNSGHVGMAGRRGGSKNSKVWTMISEVWRRFSHTSLGPSCFVLWCTAKCDTGRKTGRRSMSEIDVKQVKSASVWLQKFVVVWIGLPHPLPFGSRKGRLWGLEHAPGFRIHCLNAWQKYRATTMVRG